MAIIGYHSTAGVGLTPDPLRTLDYGYRSKALRKPYPELNIDQELSYNGFHFPPATKVTASVVPEYDKTNKTIKYLNIILTVDAIITQYDLEKPTVETPAPPSGPYGATTDRHMDAIRERLAQPGQTLKFTLHGFGTIIVNDPDYSPSLKDVDYGPKTQVVEWEPIGGALSCRVQWLVSTRIPPCNPVQAHGIAELNYSISVSLDESGTPTHTISGHFQVVGSYAADEGAITAERDIDRLNLIARINTAIVFLRDSFKPLGQPTQTVSYSLSEDWKSVSFTFTYKFVASPNVYFPHTSQCDVTESLSSSRDMGFIRWKWSVNGTFTVFRGLNGSQPGKTVINANKAATLRNFGYLVTNKLNLLLTTGKSDLTVPNAASQNATGAAGNKPSSFILESFSLEDQLFSNSFSTSIAYTIINAPTSVITASLGVFEPVDMTGATPTNTIENRKNLLVNQKVFDVTGTNLAPPNAALINLCLPMPSLGEAEEATEYEEEAHNPQNLLSSRAPDEEHSWLIYENRFSYRTRWNTTLAVPLNDEVVAVQDSYEAKYEKSTIELHDIRKKEAFTPNYGKQPVRDNIVENPTSPQVFITMTGKAARIGFDIPLPQLIKIGNLIAYPYGEDIVSRYTKSAGDITTKGRTGNIYFCRWERNYVIYGNPKDTYAQTDGHPQYYL